MTQVIIDDIVPRTQLVAAASQTVFNTTWTTNATTDVVVYARADGVDADDETQVVSTNDYNVTLIGGSETVRVTFLSGRVLNDVITIVRNTPAERLNLYINTNFVPSMLNNDFGILTLVDQQAQMYDTVIAPHYNVSATIEAGAPDPADVILPILGANQIWAMNPSRTAIIPYDVPAGGGVAPADAEYLIRVANSDLPNAQVMGGLASGLVVNTTTTGVQLTRILTGVTNQTSITNGSGIAGNPTVGIADNARFPGIEGVGIPSGSTAQRPVSPVGTSLRYNTSIPSLEYWDGLAWVQLGEQDGVEFLTGTANQVLVNGTSGIPTNGSIILTTPQDIAPTSSPTFDNLTLTGTEIDDVNGNIIIHLSPIALAGNFISIANNVAGSSPEIGAGGVDANINVTYRSKAAGYHQFISDNTTVPMLWSTGTSAQHITRWAVADTAQDRTITLQDASGTMAYLSDIPAGSPSALTRVDDTNVTITLGGSPTVALLAATSLTMGWTGQLSLARGGSNANLTASDGGIVYSTATAMAILAGTVTAGQMLQSGSSAAPSWSTSTYPATNAINTLLYASAANTMAALTAVNRASLSSNSTGVPTWLALTDGQIVIGSTAGSPAAASLTAGSGVSITNGAGSITISVSGGGLAIATIAGTSQSAAVNTSYIALNAGQTTVTLPAVYAVGDIIALIGATANTGGWILTAATGDTIRVNNGTTSAGGTVTCTAVAGQCIEVVCDVDNTSWIMTSTSSVLLTTA